jgi:hypothetical protein
MRKTISALLLLLPAVAANAAHSPDGRWEGSVHIAGRPLPIVVDLAQDAGGSWTGSIILQGLGVKGAPLSNVVVTDKDLSFDAGPVLASPTFGPARFKAYFATDADMAGEMRQGGNAANFALRKIARAQVEPAPHSTPVTGDLSGPWTGEYELGGYPRHVTITFENHAGAAASAQFVIIGKQTTNLPVDLVTQEGDLLHVESKANRVTFEGRYSTERGEIRGTIELDSFELPLVLHRAAGKAS